MCIRTSGERHVESTYTPLDGFQAAVAVPSFCFISEKVLVGVIYLQQSGHFE